MAPGSWLFSCHHSFHDVSRNVGEPEIATVVTIGQFFVIEAQQGQNSRMQIMDVNFALDGSGAEFIGGAIDGATADATTRQDGGESLGIVIAARVIVSVAIANRLAAKFSAPDD